MHRPSKFILTKAAVDIEGIISSILDNDTINIIGIITSLEAFFGNKTNQITCGVVAQTAVQLNGVLVT